MDYMLMAERKALAQGSLGGAYSIYYGISIRRSDIKYSQYKILCYWRLDY
jgi:hypothetical protein